MLISLYLLPVICRLIFFSLPVFSLISCRVDVYDLEVIANSKIYDTFVTVASAPHHTPLSVTLSYTNAQIVMQTLTAPHLSICHGLLLFIKIVVRTHRTHSVHEQNDDRDRRLTKVPQHRVNSLLGRSCVSHHFYLLFTFEHRVCVSHEHISHSKWPGVLLRSNWILRNEYCLYVSCG